MAQRRGRGRINSIEALPPDCDNLIALAVAGLNDRKRDQIEVYREFHDGCSKLIADSHGELDFRIPSKSSFNRYSMSLASLTRGLEETRAIADVVASRFNAESSDNIVLIATAAIQSAVFQVLTAMDPLKIDARDFKALADALKSAAQAQGLSTTRRQKLDAEFKAKASQAVGAAAKARGLTQDVADEILSKILGVKKKAA